MQIRKLILKLHLIAGLISALFLIVLGVTGAEMAFEEQIDHMLNPKLSYVHSKGQRLSLTDLKTKLENAKPGYQVSAIGLSNSDDISWTVVLVNKEQKKNEALAVNQYTGDILGNEADRSELVGSIHQFHIRLMAGKTGQVIVTAAAVFLFFLAIGGLILWWPRKILKINLSSSGKRLTFDLHNAIGIYSSIFLLIFAITGVVIHWDNELANMINSAAHAQAPQPPSRPDPPAAGAIPLSPDQLVALAEKAEPGAKVSFIGLSDNPKSPVSVSMKFPEDLTPGGRTRVTLDAYTGKVLSAQDSRTAPLGFRVAKVWNRAIHTGDIFGWTSKILAAIFSLMLPVMAVTGPLIWWGRRRKKSAVTPERAVASAV